MPLTLVLAAYAVYAERGLLRRGSSSRKPSCSRRPPCSASGASAGREPAGRRLAAFLFGFAIAVLAALGGVTVARLLAGSCLARGVGGSPPSQ